MFPPSARQLWRRRRAAPCRAQGEEPEEAPHALRPAALQLFHRLKDGQLAQLAEALEGRGRCDRGCVWLPLDPRPARHALPPCALLCKLYRWPDLRGPSELKRLAHCDHYWRGDTEGTTVCCNPYHLSRLANPDAAAPLSCKGRDPPSWSKPLHPIGSSHSNVRGVQDTTLSRGSSKDGHWCKVAYWEHRSRVGRLYNVTEPSIQIFHDLPKGSGFCLGLLNPNPRSLAVKRTRTKIGQGLILSREQDDVWVYNRSEHPVFINSPTMAPATAVHKLLPGYSIKVFDSQQAVRISGCSAPGDGPCDPHSIRISFAKGWGHCYSRQFITSCPCWLEILLSKPK